MTFSTSKDLYLPRPALDMTNLRRTLKKEKAPSSQKRKLKRSLTAILSIIVKEKFMIIKALISKDMHCKEVYFSSGFMEFFLENVISIIILDIRSLIAGNLQNSNRRFHNYFKPKFVRNERKHTFFGFLKIDIECYKCHNFGHKSRNYRSKLIPTQQNEIEAHFSRHKKGHVKVWRRKVKY